MLWSFWLEWPDTCEKLQGLLIYLCICLSIWIYLCPASSWSLHSGWWIEFPEWMLCVIFSLYNILFYMPIHIHTYIYRHYCIYPIQCVHTINTCLDLLVYHEVPWLYTMLRVYMFQTRLETQCSSSLKCFKTIWKSREIDQNNRSTLADLDINYKCCLLALYIYVCIVLYTYMWHNPWKGTKS